MKISLTLKAAKNKAEIEGLPLLGNQFKFAGPVDPEWMKNFMADSDDDEPFML